MKNDPKKTLKHLYAPSARDISLVQVPEMNFLMIDGSGDPNTNPEYTEAVEALFSVSYTAKFMLKKAPGGIDYAVMPLEGLWWADDMSAFTGNDRSQWRWTMMIMQPDFVSDGLVHEAIGRVVEKKALPALHRLRYEAFAEGTCAQTLHIGPFSEEGPTIQRVHDFIGRTGRLGGRHHEIYLSDIRRAAPERWRTIIRQPCILAEQPPL